MSLSKFIETAGNVVSKTAEVGLPLVGLAAEGGAGMAAGNHLASFVPGTIQSDKRQASRQSFYDQQAEHGMQTALATSRAMMFDQFQETRKDSGLHIDDAFDNRLLDSQDGKQAVAIEAIAGLMLRGDKDSMRIVQKLAGTLGASVDVDAMTFTHRGQTYDLDEANMTALRDHAIRNTAEGFVLAGINQAAKLEFGAAVESNIGKGILAKGYSEKDAVAGIREIRAQVPAQHFELLRLSEAYSQLATDESNKNVGGLVEKKERAHAEIEAFPGVDMVGGVDGMPMSTWEVNIEYGSPAQKLLNIPSGSPYASYNGTMKASEFAARISAAINLPARISQYNEKLRGKNLKEENQRQYDMAAVTERGREDIQDFVRYLRGNPSLAGIEPDDLGGGYKITDAYLAEFRRWKEFNKPTNESVRAAAADTTPQEAYSGVANGPPARTNSEVFSAVDTTGKESNAQRKQAAANKAGSNTREILKGSK